MLATNPATRPKCYLHVRSANLYFAAVMLSTCYLHNVINMLDTKFVKTFRVNVVVYSKEQLFITILPTCWAHKISYSSEIFWLRNNILYLRLHSPVDHVGLIFYIYKIIVKWLPQTSLLVWNWKINNLGWKGNIIQIQLIEQY